MRKILIGVIAAVVIAVAGALGFQFYVQHRVVAEVDTAFAQIRAAGGKASHGKVAFDLWTRTLTVADIAVESAEQPPTTVKIARLTARGIGQPDPNRFSADSIDAEDVEVSAMLAPNALRGTYRAPRIGIAAYSGPAGQIRPLDNSQPGDVYRLVVEQFSAITAASVSAPSLVLTMTPMAGTAPAGGSGEYAYANLAMHDIRGGKIATSTIGRTSLSANIDVGGKIEKMTGELSDAAFYDFDVAPVAAMLDPARAKDDNYVRIYRQAKVGAYTISLPNGPTSRLEGMTFDDIGIRPSRLQAPLLAAFLAAAPPPGVPPSPAQTRKLLEAMAGLYEGVRIGNAETRGLSVNMPDGPFKIAAMRFNIENGKVGEFAIEGVEGRSPQGPVKIGRFALKSFDVANMMRTASDFATPGQQPRPDQLLALLPLLEGAEVTGFVAPYKDSTAPLNIETVSLNWGQFVGPIPSKVHLIAKLTAPVDASDPNLATLIAAGIRSAAVNVDLGAAWAEGTHSFVLEPVVAELGGVLNVSARVSLGNVPREVFSANPLQAAVMAAQIEAGPLEITLRDLGGVDLALTQFARMQNVNRQAARQILIDAIRANAAAMVAANPEVQTVADALIRFISTPQGSLTIRLTPQGKVPMMELINALKAYPMAALAKFQIAASTGL